MWHDCDKLVALPDCVALMLGAPLDFGGPRPSGADIYLSNNSDGGACHRFNSSSRRRYKFQSSHGRCGAYIHVGSFVAHRVASAAILREWKRHVHLEPQTIDFVLLWNAWHALNASSHAAPSWFSRKRPPSPPRVAKLPARLEDHMWAFNDTRCINHITSGRLSGSFKKNRAAIYPLYESLCLSTPTPRRYLQFRGQPDAHRFA